MVCQVWWRSAWHAGNRRRLPVEGLVSKPIFVRGASVVSFYSVWSVSAMSDMRFPDGGERKVTLPAALSRVIGGPRAVREPGHVRNLHTREPGDPTFARLGDHWVGRLGNARAVRLR